MTVPSTPVTAAAESFLLPGGETGCLIIHGYGGSIGDYRQCAELLQQQGLTVLGLRLAGHGQGKAALRQTTVTDWQASVESGWQELRSRCRRTIIMGSSFGGVLALDLAHRHPSEIDGLILVNTALSYSGGGVLQGVLLRLMRLVTPYYPKKGLTPAERERGQQMGSTDAWPINGILATATFARRSIVPILSEIHQPALILSSSHDAVVGPQNSQRLMETLGSAAKESVIIPVQTHRPFRDAQAVEYIAQQVLAFIRRHLVG
ncbi:MAG: alpha/beta fold hydrolase [Candidatus Kerfeldbacteria bacterium]|nr:alpha/beta fold hydrolase [Candidatus Kerfeldbacteria bacterium]